MIFPRTTTVREIQRNYKKVFEHVKRTKEPTIVLKNNKPDVAIIDIQRFEELEMQEAINSAQQGMEERKSGKAITARSLKHLSAAYWQNLRRMIEKSRSLKGARGNLSEFIAQDRKRH